MNDIQLILDCQVTASLLLEEPTREKLELIKRLTGEQISLASCQESFENLFRLPGSACYVPVYEHVLKDLKNGMNGKWKIDPDKSHEIEMLFDRYNFQWKPLMQNMPTLSATLAADHVGLILLFLASVVRSGPNIQDPQIELISRDLIKSLDNLEVILLSLKDTYAKAVASILNETSSAFRQYFEKTGEIDT